MRDEDAFLHAIRAAPGDDLARLVYADWLDERGDPRWLTSPPRHRPDDVRRP